MTLTAIEKHVIDTRVAQRLRYVAQSGLAHLVFPEVRTSRFSHSLGAMHLASRFLAASLANADSETKAALLGALRATVLEAEDVFRPETLAPLVSEGLETPRAVADDARPVAVLVEQGLRLAALFHDIGHLPFSHDYEYAVGELAAEREAQDPEGAAARRASGAPDDLDSLVGAAAPGDSPLHERIGHALSGLLLEEAIEELSGDQVKAARATFSIAQKILRHTPSESGGNSNQVDAALGWLKLLIAGELDVDRCDYVLRDARNFGFEFAIYDLGRLVDNLTVVSEDGAFVPAVLARGQSAVETLLVARSRMYQYGVRHHKVAQVGAALRHEIGEMLKPTLLGPGDDGPFDEFVGAVVAVLRAVPDGVDDPGGLLDRFAAYDDVWWMARMREEALRRPDDEWLQLICWRSKGPRSLWKRDLDFSDDPDRLLRFNRRLPTATSKEHPAFERAIRSLRKDGVLVLRHRFEPWKPRPAAPNGRVDSQLSFVRRDGRLVPVTQVSRLVYSLREAWTHSVQVQAFARSDAKLTAQDVLDRLSGAEGLR